MVEEENLLNLVGALIGAISGSVGVNLVAEWQRRRSEKESLRKNIVDKYLIQFQDAVQNLLYRLRNIKDQGGPYYMMLVKGNEEYYTLSTMYVLGAVLAYHRILLFGGIYSQIEMLFPSFGTKLSNQLGKFGNNLDSLKVQSPKTNEVIPFFRYDRITLGDAVTEETDERYYIRSFLKFKIQYENDKSLKSILMPAYEFVHALQYSEHLDLLMKDLKNILTELEAKTMVQSPIKDN